MIIPQARIWLCMAHDGLLPKFFGAVHPKFRTPHISTLITGVAAATFAGLLPIGILGELVSIGTLIAFIVVCLGVLVLRYTGPICRVLSGLRPYGSPRPWGSSSVPAWPHRSPRRPGGGWCCGAPPA